MMSIWSPLAIRGSWTPEMYLEKLRTSTFKSLLCVCIMGFSGSKETNFSPKKFLVFTCSCIMRKILKLTRTSALLVNPDLPWLSQEELDMMKIRHFQKALESEDVKMLNVQWLPESDQEPLFHLHRFPRAFSTPLEGNSPHPRLQSGPEVRLWPDNALSQITLREVGLCCRISLPHL